MIDRRRLYLGLGYAAVALGLLNALLPVLPTSPFLLVGAWLLARGAPEHLEILRRDRRVGPWLGLAERRWAWLLTWAPGWVWALAGAAALVGLGWGSSRLVAWLWLLLPGELAGG